MISNIGPRAFDYGVNVVHSVCRLAGVPSYLDDLRADLRESGRTADAKSADGQRKRDTGKDDTAKHS